jgi:hypothetical protein
MSSYFFGGFSAYLIVPSGRQLNQPGCSLQPGMVRRALDGEVERDFQSVLRRGRDQRGGNLPCVPSSRMDRVMAAFAAPMA